MILRYPRHKLMILTTTNYNPITAHWADVYQEVNIPAELILDIQVTAPDLNCTDVHLAGCRIVDSTVQLTLRLGDGTLIGELTTTTVGLPVSFTCAAGYTANILLGDIPQIAGAADYITTPIKINPELVSVAGRGSASTMQRLIIVQDGVTLVDEVLTTDRVLLVDTGLQMSEVVNGSVTISPGEDVVTAEIGGMDTHKRIRSINNIAGDHLQLQITISVHELVHSDTETLQQIGNKLIINSSSYGPKLAIVDPIDKRIHPDNRSADYQYRPLDDAYIVLKDGEYSISDTRRFSDKKSVDKTPSTEGIPGVYVLDAEALVGYRFSPVLCAIDTKFDSTDEVKK